MTEFEQSHLREVALKMARDLNPNTINPQHYGTLGGYQATVSPSTSTIINAAEVIYKWLLSGVNDYKSAEFVPIPKV